MDEFIDESMGESMGEAVADSIDQFKSRRLEREIVSPRSRHSLQFISTIFTEPSGNISSLGNSINST